MIGGAGESEMAGSVNSAKLTCLPEPKLWLQIRNKLSRKGGVTRCRNPRTLRVCAWSRGGHAAAAGKYRSGPFGPDERSLAARSSFSVPKERVVRGFVSIPLRSQTRSCPFQRFDLQSTPTAWYLVGTAQALMCVFARYVDPR